MRGFASRTALERPSFPLRVPLWKTQMRVRFASPCLASRLAGGAVRRRTRRTMALPDHFSQAGSKVSFNKAASNVDVMPVDLPKQSHGHKDPMSRDHSWDEWLEYFDQVETIERKMQELEEEMHEDVVIEHYQDAAGIRERLDTLHQQDIVAAIHQELEKAVEEERYDDAAKLRDEGLAGLHGWWVVRGPDDPQGQLMMLSQEFCRYSGRLFTPKEIVTLCAISETAGMGEILSEREDEPMGQFAMEVFLKRDAEGRLQHQGCVLRSAEFIEEEDSDEEQELLETNVYIQPAEDRSENSIKVTVSLVMAEDEDEKSTENAETDAEVASVLSAAAEEAKESTETETIPLEPVDEQDNDKEMELKYRNPADIKWWDRNRFVLSVDEEFFHAEEEEDSDSESEEKEEEENQEESKVTTAELIEGYVTTAIENAVSKVPTQELKPFLNERLTHQSLVKALNALVKLKLKELEKSAERSQLAWWAEEMAENSVSQERRMLEGEVMFTRLPKDDCPTDPFTGFFVGRFGNHGFQLLHASRHLDKASRQEFLHVRKITGDPNVPAGELSFRVSIDRENRTVPDVMHAEELGIRAQYSGQGIIAETGFNKPRWVDGELLLFDPHNPVAGGAEMGLVWNVPNYRRAHVMLYRITFPEAQ